jgi:hypothetical protein
MVSLSDLDTSSKSEYDSSQDSTSEIDEDSDDETLEPERDAWDPTTQLHAAQLHAKIKAQAELLIPTYPKLPRRWPFRLFDVRTLPDYVHSPIHYFELFWGLEI